MFLPQHAIQTKYNMAARGLRVVAVRTNIGKLKNKSTMPSKTRNDAVAGTPAFPKK